MLREMGQQVRDGLATPRQLLSVPEYAEALGRGTQALERLDMGALADELDEVDTQADRKLTG